MMVAEDSDRERDRELSRLAVALERTSVRQEAMGEKLQEMDIALHAGLRRLEESIHRLADRTVNREDYLLLRKMVLGGAGLILTYVLLLIIRGAIGKGFLVY